MKKKDVELVEYLARIYRHDQLMLLMSDGLAVCEGEDFERYLQAEDFVNLIDMYLESLSDEQQLYPCVIRFLIVRIRNGLKTFIVNLLIVEKKRRL